MAININITVGGKGSRLKKMSNLEKYNLYYKNKTIIEYILEIFPDAHIVGKNKTNNRKETLSQIKEKNNVLIIDCDIIPFGINLKNINFFTDNIYVFHSLKNKYGSVVIEKNRLIEINEKKSISNYKCSGVYFCKNLESTIERMTDNDSIASGMIGSNVVVENTFKRFGDIDDYYEAIGL
jgi:predicted PilT family ATPase